MSTLSPVELGVLGPLQVRQFGLPVPIPGAKPRAILTMLGLYGGAVVPADTLVELLWGMNPPRTAAKALQTHISAVRRALGEGFVLTQGTGWTLNTADIDAVRYTTAARGGREAMAAGDSGQAVACFGEALKLWRGAPELPEGRRGATERTRWVEGHAALVEDRADALLATGRGAEIIGELEAAIADAPLRERRWGQLMLALYRAGRQGEALAAYQRARAMLADELGVDPGPDLRRLESKIVAQDISLELPVAQHLSAVTRAVTFLLTDIEGSTAAWETDAAAMGSALARHDEIVEQVVTFRGGRLIKTRGEGDATFSVFDRPSGAAAAAVELQEAIGREPWALAKPVRIRIALHTGEVEFRDGDYFGRAVNRAARLRSLAAGGQTLCSGATAELVIDSLADDVVLADLGTRQLKNLARPEHVFELRLENTADLRAAVDDVPVERPDLPPVLVGHGPFVGRGRELERLWSAWQTTQAAGTCAVLIAGEPGVGKTRLAGEWSRQAFDQGGFVLYGRCDEDLGAPYQPFAEALRSLVPCLGTSRLRELRGVEALLSLAPGLTDVLPDLTAPPRADADTERYALFDAVVGLLGVTSATAPVVLVLDDLHWAAKPTLLLLRHLLRFGEHARVQIVGTYRSTDLDRSHPLAAMLADLHRDGSAHRLALGGLDEDDVSAYVAEAGYDDDELARALASVTGGNPFFLIEALRHVDESGGHWNPSTLPQGVREAVSRRLSRLPAETNRALAAAAVVGSRFAVELVERVVEQDLVDAFDEACKAGILFEEPGGRYRFNHALVRQSLLAELASMRRMRLHQRIATVLESEPNANGELLAELAYHYFECAWAGNATKAVDYCRRAADQAMAGLAYEGAADLYDKALHALEELDDELPDREDQQAELLVARCEALLAAGDVVSATGAAAQLQSAASDSDRLAAWGTCFDGQLSMLTDPERLDQIESAVGAAAATLAELDDAAGEAKAHTVRAACLARLGRIGDCETALDQALTAARRAREHRRVNAVLAGAPLAALWGPNPVPRAGGRCLDVVRLLRITTGSPVVEATSTRCQGVLDALRGRSSAGRQLIDSARRTLNELGMRHAVLEVEQFAGIVELIADDAAAAERHLRNAYNGFRRMGLEADTAETAALLARACLLQGRDAGADELCTESERLAGHAFKAAIAWRSVRAQLLARAGEHDGARRIAEEAVAIAERTDALVDHGDACLALATVLGAAGDASGARAAAERAVALYDLKGAVALAEKAHRLLGQRPASDVPAPSDTPVVEPDNLCVDAGRSMIAAVEHGAWDEVEQLLAPAVHFESRRRIVGVTPLSLSIDQWRQAMERYVESGMTRYQQERVAVRGDRLALVRLSTRTDDASAGAPVDEFLQLAGVDDEGRICLQMWFDIEDLDTALVELDTLHARSETERRRPLLENAASRIETRCYALFAEGSVEDIGALLTEDHRNEDRRLGLGRESSDRAAALENIRVIAGLGVNITNTPLALRGGRLCLSHILFEKDEAGGHGFRVETLELTELNSSGLMGARVVFALEDFDAAITELDARYLAGEAAPYAQAWAAVAGAYAAFNRREIAATTPGWMNIDHRRGAAFAPGDMTAYLSAAWADSPDTRIYVDAVHRLTELGAVVTHAAKGVSHAGFEAEWRDVNVLTVASGLIDRSELFDADDLDSALARFDELGRSGRTLGNAASLVYARLWQHFHARDWDAVAAVFVDDISNDDRRRVVNAGVERGRDVQLANLRRLTEIGATVSSTIRATRGQHLVLNRVHASNSDLRSGEFDSEMINVIETDSEGRIVAGVLFDRDDLGAAFAELDARYLAGEAAPHARTWSIISQAYAGMTRGEVPGTTADLVNIDHRHVAPMAPDDGIAYLRASWDVAPEFNLYIEAVHRLSDLGAVFTRWSKGTSRGGFDAEWRAVDVITVERDLISRGEIFDEPDLEAALARFDELSQSRRLENTASRIYRRWLALYEARDWSAMSEVMAEDVVHDDRRRVVNGGVQHGGDAVITNMRAIAAVGVTNIEPVVIAIRGDRLALIRQRVSGTKRPDAFGSDVLIVVGVDADDHFASGAAYDPDDIEAAFAELDARYLAGEAGAHAAVWSVIADVIAALNRHELASLSSELVDFDRRRVTAFEPGDLTEYVRAAWELTPDLTVYVESVHRLTDSGAMFTYVATGTAQHDFQTEWRGISLSIVDGQAVNRFEQFDEADLDAALARFDQLSRPAPLPSAASQWAERFRQCFAARDWQAIREMLADSFILDDRRRTVNAGIRHGRDAEIEDLRAAADVGFTDVKFAEIASRGEHLALAPVEWFGPEQQLGTFRAEWLGVVDIDADGRVAALVMLDADDFDAAFEELDARYLAGEARRHASIWSLVTQTYAAFNRHELSKTTPDWANIDHRLGVGSAPGDMNPYVSAMWTVVRDVSTRIVAVHRLSNLGAVFTHTERGTSHEGFDAEWREVALLTFDGDAINRCELFDETDIDAAVARFDELDRRAQCPENAASRAGDLLRQHYAARDWEALADMLAADSLFDDRRHVVNSGRTNDRDVAVAQLSSTADAGTEKSASACMATRGERLALGRFRYSSADTGPERFYSEFLAVVEIDGDNRIVARTVFDSDDIEAAFAELDARYLAGEALAHVQTWSAIVNANASFNRREMPSTTPEWVTVDHRRGGMAFAPGAMAAYIRATWDVAPDVRNQIVVVHRLSDRGAVFTQAVHGTSQAGFNAGWRDVIVMMVGGDVITRCEVYEEDELGIALARFEELGRTTMPPLENDATRTWARIVDAFNRRDTDQMLAVTRPDGQLDDRRTGVRDFQDGSTRERVVQTLFEYPASWCLAIEHLAVRGSRLCLSRQMVRDTGEPDRPITIDCLTVMEVGDDGVAGALVNFDLADIDGAITELTARWIASGEVAYPEVIEAARLSNSAYNRHDWVAVGALERDAVYVNHRQLISAAAETIGDHWRSIRALASLIPDLRIVPADVLAHSADAIVSRVVVTGTNTEGSSIELPALILIVFDGDRVTRMESFDIDQRELALARFAELDRD